MLYPLSYGAKASATRPPPGLLAVPGVLPDDSSGRAGHHPHVIIRDDDPVGHTVTHPPLERGHDATTRVLFKHRTSFELKEMLAVEDQHVPTIPLLVEVTGLEPANLVVPDHAL